MRIRDVKVSSPGMSDKTMEKFRRLCQIDIQPALKQRDYGLNAGHFMKNEKYVYCKHNTIIIITHTHYIIRMNFPV